MQQHTVIEYGNCVWGPFYKGDQVMPNKLQRLQI